MAVKFRWPVYKDKPTPIDEGHGQKYNRENLVKAYFEIEKLIEASSGADNDLKLQARAISEKLKWSRSDDELDHRVAAAYAAVYTKVSETREKLIREVEKIRAYYLCDVIITHLTEDSTMPDISTGKIINVTSDVELIEKEIKKLDEKIGFDQIISSITPDLISYGEYTLSTKINPSPKSKEIAKLRNNKMTEDNYWQDPETISNIDPKDDDSDNYGLIELLDDVDQAKVISISKYGDIQGFLVQEGNKVIKKEPADYVKFSLSSQKVRLDLFKEFSLNITSLPDELANIPRFVRTGRSIIFPIIPKLKELELLEALVPATKLSKLSAGTLIGVQVPAGMDVKSAMEAVQTVEGLINKKVGVDPKIGAITLENILATAGKLKVVPIFGDKGTLSKLDYKSDEPDDLLKSVDDIRRVILTSAGIPYEIVFDADNGQGKGQILKKYARYLRKLKAIQRSIEDGIKQIVYIHLSNKGIPFKAEDIKVEFHHKLIEIDNLDKLEFMDTTVAMLKSLKDFIMDLANKETSPFAERIRIDGFLEFLNEQLSLVGLGNLIDCDGDGSAEGDWEGDPNKVVPSGEPLKVLDVNKDKIKLGA